MNQKLRRKILEHYGETPPKCSKCQCDIYKVLDLDHIKNDGKEERKRFHGNLALYKYIIKNNYPKKYQVLCKNCNWLKFYETKII